MMSGLEKHATVTEDFGSDKRDLQINQKCVYSVALCDLQVEQLTILECKALATPCNTMLVLVPQLSGLIIC